MVSQTLKFPDDWTRAKKHQWATLCPCHHLLWRNSMMEQTHQCTPGNRRTSEWASAGLSQFEFVHMDNVCVSFCALDRAPDQAATQGEHSCHICQLLTCFLHCLIFFSSLTLLLSSLSFQPNMFDFKEAQNKNLPTYNIRNIQTGIYLHMDTSKTSNLLWTSTIWN